MKLNSRMSTTLALVLLTPLLLLTWMLAGTNSTRASDTEAPPLASVNDQPITTADLDFEINRIAYRARLRGQRLEPERIETLKPKLTEMLIHRELLYQESVRQGILITDADVDKMIANIKSTLPNKSAYDDMLSAFNVSQAAFKTKLKRGMAIESLLDDTIRNQITVTEEEADYVYKSNPNAFKTPEQVRASHILIKLEPDASDAQKAEAREKLNALKNEIKTGADFAELARRHSEGPSAVKGGDLGYFERGKMVKPFADAAFALDPGQISEIVETRFGYHLIKLVDRKPESTLEFAAVKPRLMKTIKEQRIRDAIQETIERLKKSAHIKRLGP